MNAAQNQPNGTRRAAIARRPFIAGIAGGLAYAIIMFLAFAPVGAWPLAPFAVTPLAILAIADGPGAKRRTLGVLLGVAPFWAVQMQWVGAISVAGYLPLVLYLALYPAIYFYTVQRLRTRTSGAGRVAAAFAVWIIIEVVRTRLVFDGFAWYMLGHPLIEAGPVLSWPARIGGAELVALLSAVVGVGLAGVLSCRAARGRCACISLVILIGWCGGGGVVAGMRPAASTEIRTLRVAIVQTDVPQSVRGGWEPEARIAAARRFLQMTVRAASAGSPPDVIVWPETMYPGMALQPDAVGQFEADAARFDAGARDSAALWATYEQDFATSLLGTQKNAGVPMLVGASGYTGFAFRSEDPEAPTRDWDQRFNSVFLIDDGAVVGRYDKQRLTPFGEVMPYVSAWPWLESQILRIGLGASGMSFNLAEGTGPRTIEADLAAGRVMFAPRICFEMTDPGAVRGRGTADVGDVLVNATNDGWFGGWRPGRQAHLLSARWRCVELDRPMIRAANTGISALIDRWGRVVVSGTDDAPGADGVEGVLTGAIELGGGEPPYLAGGWWPAMLVPVIGLVTLLFAVGHGSVRSKTERRDSENE